MNHSKVQKLTKRMRVPICAFMKHISLRQAHKSSVFYLRCLFYMKDASHKRTREIKTPSNEQALLGFSSKPHPIHHTLEQKTSLCKFVNLIPLPLNDKIFSYKEKERLERRQEFAYTTRQ